MAECGCGNGGAASLAYRVRRTVSSLLVLRAGAACWCCVLVLPAPCSWCCGIISYLMCGKHREFGGTNAARSATRRTLAIENIAYRRYVLCCLPLYALAPGAGDLLRVYATLYARDGARSDAERVRAQSSRVIDRVTDLPTTNYVLKSTMSTV